MSAATLEFYVSNDEIRVMYNLKKISFSEFLALDGTKPLIQKICKAIKKQYPDENTCQDQFCMKTDQGDFQCHSGSIVGKFIKKHFLKRDKFFDLLISENSDYVRFFPEDQ